MPLPERIMIDSSAFYALATDDDKYSQVAAETYDRMLDRDLELWTTSYALLETIALVQRRFGFPTLSRFLETIEPNVRILWIDSAIHSAAMGEFTAARGRGMSLVDWTVVLAARIKFAHVFTFDGGIINSGAAIAHIE